MRSYTLHLPAEARPGEAHGLDRAQVVPDGFSWAAFAFTFLWFFYHRLWLAGLGVLAGLAAVAGIGRLLGLSPGAGFVIALLVSILIGFEASSLRRWTLARRGRPARDAVVAANAEDAEIRALSRWLDGSGPVLPVRGYGSTPAATPVIGLFPFGEGGR